MLLCSTPLSFESMLQNFQGLFNYYELNDSATIVRHSKDFFIELPAGHLDLGKSWLKISLTRELWTANCECGLWGEP